jgi:hypothetical protein
MNGCRCIDAQHAKALIALLTLHRLAHDSRAFEWRIESIALQTTQVKKNIRHAAVGDDEAVTPRDIKPFYETGNLKNPDIRFRRLLFPSPARL